MEFFENPFRVAMRNSSGVLPLHTDHPSTEVTPSTSSGQAPSEAEGLRTSLGSTSVATDVSGNPISKQTYFAFGAVRTSEGSSPTDYGFTGQRFDASSALMYYGARYYDPVLGRFTQADPIVSNAWNPQSLNRYEYVYNNPVRYTDPSGYCVPELFTCGPHGDPEQGGPPPEPPPVRDEDPSKYGDPPEPGEPPAPAEKCHRACKDDSGPSQPKPTPTPPASQTQNNPSQQTPSLNSTNLVATGWGIDACLGNILCTVSGSEDVTNLSDSEDQEFSYYRAPDGPFLCSGLCVDGEFHVLVGSTADPAAPLSTSYGGPFDTVVINTPLVGFQVSQSVDGRTVMVGLSIGPSIPSLMRVQTTYKAEEHNWPPEPKVANAPP